VKESVTDKLYFPDGHIQRNFDNQTSERVLTSLVRVTLKDSFYNKPVLL